MKAPLSFKEFSKIIERLKAEDEYFDKCHEVYCDIYEEIVSFDMAIRLVDKMFTPEGAKNDYDSFCWWVYDSEFGSKDLCCWKGESGEIEVNVTKPEDIYKLMCEEKGCEPDWE